MQAEPSKKRARRVEEEKGKEKEEEEEEIETRAPVRRNEYEQVQILVPLMQAYLAQPCVEYDPSRWDTIVISDATDIYSGFCEFAALRAPDVRVTYAMFMGMIKCNERSLGLEVFEPSDRRWAFHFSVGAWARGGEEGVRDWASKATLGPDVTLIKGCASSRLWVMPNRPACSGHVRVVLITNDALERDVYVEWFAIPLATYEGTGNLSPRQLKTLKAAHGKSPCNETREAVKLLETEFSSCSVKARTNGMITDSPLDVHIVIQNEMKD